MIILKRLHFQKEAGLLSVTEKCIFSEELEIIKELEHLETDSLGVIVKLLSTVFGIVLVPKLDFSLGYLLEYLEDFPLDLSFFQLVG